MDKRAKSVSGHNHSGKTKAKKMKTPMNLIPLISDNNSGLNFEVPNWYIVELRVTNALKKVLKTGDTTPLKSIIKQRKEKAKRDLRRFKNNAVLSDTESGSESDSDSDRNSRGNGELVSCRFDPRTP